MGAVSGTASVLFAQGGNVIFAHGSAGFVMTKLDVELPAGLAEWVESRVEAGLYLDPNDYIRDLIRQDLGVASAGARREEMDEMIAEGVADIEAGRVHDAEEVFAELDARYAAMEEAVPVRRKAG